MSQFSRLLKFESLESRTLLHGDAVIGPIPDVTGDGRVDELDTALVSQQFGQHTPLGDADGDGIVGQADLDIVTASLGTVAHSDDAMKQAEHLELLGLALPSQASNMAVASGSWSDPAIWSNGSVPGAGDQVWIPAWHSVEVDTQLTEALKWVRVDGELTFSTAVDTSLVADTIIGTSTAHLDINTTNPNVTTKITFADLGPIDTVWDPLAVSRGLIWHGTSEINGAEKNPWTTYKPATAGQTSLMVADASGWQVGDRLILAGEGVAWVRGKGWSRVTQDDDVTIVAIDGQTITLDHPLQYSHEAMESQNPVTINLTRNVVFQSENTAIDRRGHLMFMHNSGQEISYVELDNLGRTDKSQPITRPDGLGNGLENRDGRYALHFHRAGRQGPRDSDGHCDQRFSRLGTRESRQQRTGRPQRLVQRNRGTLCHRTRNRTGQLYEQRGSPCRGRWKLRHLYTIYQ